jgi:crotonobetainyl-CoA:carnitine CoA-transferase CaiB-like acyl-CoA transferase
MGLAPATLQAQNPALIIVRVSGFGQTGPYAPRPGFGTLVEAMSGFSARNGFADREPVLPPLALADMIAGLYGAFATVTALRAQERGTAPGQVIDLSLLEPIISILGPEAASYTVTRQVKERVGSGSNTASPRNVYQTRDGKWIALSGSVQAMAERVLTRSMPWWVAGSLPRRWRRPLRPLPTPRSPLHRCMILPISCATRM